MNNMKYLAFSLLFTGMSIAGYAQYEKSPFQAIVAADGSGDYLTIQKAVDAVPEGRNKPWLILVKNGSYAGQVIIPKNKPYVHLIGQDKDKTIIHLNLNVGGKPTDKELEENTVYWRYSVHNPESPVYKYERAVVIVYGNHFYTQNISFINDWGVESFSGPQALAMSSQADCASFYNCTFRSFQDTWMTSTDDSHRHYVKNCWIEGAVDYFYGSGDVLLENCTLYNVRSGSVIVAPCHKNSKYGYAFRNCIVDGNTMAADGKLKLGRPWHNAPKAVYINTLMRIPVAPEGWANMGTVPGLFAEYNSRDIYGNLVDLSQRKTQYQYKDRKSGKEYIGSCQTTITREEADRYTYENMILGVDSWNPREMMTELNAPRELSYKAGYFTWKPVKDAIGYVVFDGEQVIGTTTATSFPVQALKYSLKVCAVNAYGTLGKWSVL